jgi:hypothetical protein
MADQDFEIKIRATADTAGVKQTQAELEKLASGPSKTVADQLKAAGAVFDPKTGTFHSVAKGIEEAGKAAEKSAGLTSQYRYALASLVNELLRGQVTAQGLSRQLPLLGAGALAIGGATALAEAITKTVIEATALDSELSKIHTAAITMGSAEGPDVFKKNIVDAHEELTKLLEDAKAASGERGFWGRLADASTGVLKFLAGYGTKDQQDAARLDKIKQLRQDQVAQVDKLREALSREAEINETLLNQGPFAAEQKKIELEHARQREEISKVTALTDDQRNEAVHQVNIDEQISIALLERRKSLLQTETNLREKLLEISQDQLDATIGENQARLEALKARETAASTKEFNLPEGSEEQRKAHLETVAAGQAITEEERRQFRGAGSLTRARLRDIQERTSREIEIRRIEAEKKDLRDRISRGAYGQTELSGPAFRGGVSDVGRSEESFRHGREYQIQGGGGTSEVVAAIKDNTNWLQKLYQQWQ